MVRHYNHESKPKMHSTFYLKPGQSLQNTKIADRSLALLVSRSAFDRLVGHATENERLADAAEKEAARLAALRKATYEMSKTWDNTIANITKRRKAELLNRKKRDDEARAEFVKDLAARNAAERAEVVNEARKLLLWKKPQCRLINGALLTSECYRQLDAQLAFQKTLEGIDKERDMEYAKMIKQDAENSAKEDKKKAEERLTKNRAYGQQLKKQIEGAGNDMKRLELEELVIEKHDLKNMTKEIRMIEECEAEQTAKRKLELKKIFVDSLEEKKLNETKLKLNEEFENRALQVFVESKERIKKIGKLKMKEARDEKLRHSESLARRCAAVRHSHEAEEAENLRRAMEEKEALELEKQKAKKKHDEKIRSDMEKYKADLAVIQERRSIEEKNMMIWETMQRFKRDEFNKEVKSEEIKRDWKKKIEMAQYLRKQMAEREAQRKREGSTGDDAIQMKANIERTNEKVLAYGAEVLEECRVLNESNPNRPARPLFPILKAIEQFKKESGLLPPRTYEECAPPKRRRQRRPICAKPPPPDQICYV